MSTGGSLERDTALLALARSLLDSGYRFTTVTPATQGRVNARAANAWARDAVGVFGWSRPFRADAIPSAWLDRMQAAGIAQPVDGGWRSTLRASTLDGTLYLHSAYPTVDAGAVFFGPDTVRFVAAIERHLATATHDIARAVDIGCGAGPGAIAVALARPDASVLAIDINDDAIRLARLNALLAGAANVDACKSDLLSAVDGRFDLIVANPPYLLDPGARAYRHGGGDLGEGLSLAIARLAEERLAPGGTLLLYTGSAIVDGVDHLRQALAAQSVDTTLAHDYRELDPDVFGEELLEPAYAHVDRIAAVLYTATRPAAV